MATLRRLSPFGRQRRPSGSSAVAAGSICQSMWMCGRNFPLALLALLLHRAARVLPALVPARLGGLAAAAEVHVVGGQLELLAPARPRSAAQFHGQRSPGRAGRGALLSQRDHLGEGGASSSRTYSSCSPTRRAWRRRFGIGVPRTEGACWAAPSGRRSA